MQLLDGFLYGFELGLSVSGFTLAAWPALICFMVIIKQIKS
jgi:hypothetical protein